MDNSTEGVGMKIRSVVIIALAAASLSSCETTAPTAENKAKVAQIPTNYRAQTASYLKQKLKDPYSVRDAEITEPTVIFVGLVNGGSAPGVCARMRAKNSFGAYNGIETLAVAFKNGVVMGAGEPVFDTCSKAAWRPFPEMNAPG